jgi:hypothetical protein
MPAALTRARYDAAQRFAEFVASAQQLATLWKDQYRIARVDDEAVARVAALPGRWHLLALSEDWCGDAAHTLPFLARLAELAPNLDLRLLGRDANPDLMDAHLSPAGGRAIPVVMVLDEDLVEHAWWGSRPGPLAEWVYAEGKDLDKDERYKRIRTWYARDRGRATVEEVVALLERAAATRAVAASPSIGA